MTEERRSGPRARISGARVTYETVAGDQVETDAIDIGRGGLFVRATKPLAVGKLITLEIQEEGQSAPWSAIGRIVWVREGPDGPQGPAGMGVKLIDVDDAMLGAIDRLVEVQERGAAGQADATRVAAGVKREATVLGVGTSADLAPPTPIVSITPRDRTILGVGAPAAAVEPAPPEEPGARRASSPPHKPVATREASVGREPSVVIDLVDRVDVDRPSQQTTAVTELPTMLVRRRGRGRWIFVLAFLLLAAAVAYVLLGTDSERLQRLMGAPPAPASPSATESAQPSATPTVVSWPNASPFVSAPASAHPIGSASSTPTGHTSATSTAQSTAPARPSTSTSVPARPSKKPPPEDNPY
jgi:uncharacterized protein (TIGR02266 family)